MTRRTQAVVDATANTSSKTALAKTALESAEFSHKSQVPFIADPTLQDDFSDKRSRQAYQMRLEGYSWRVIGEACGYADASGAYRAAHKLASQLRSDTPLEEERDLMSDVYGDLLDKLNKDLYSPMSGAREGDPPRVNLWVIDRITAMMAEYAKLRGLHRVDPNAVQAQVLIRDITADTSQV